MTSQELDTIAAEAAGGCSTCVELVAEVRRLRAALQLVFGDGVHRGGISVAAWVAVRDALATHPAPDTPSDTVAMPRGMLEALVASFDPCEPEYADKLRALLRGGE